MHFYRNFLVFRTFKKPTETKHRKKAGGNQTSGGELSKSRVAQVVVSWLAANEDQKNL